jgi:hypothetical protein
MAPKKPTIASVTEGLSYLHREVQALKREIAKLSREFSGLTEHFSDDDMNRELWGVGRDHQHRTDEPSSEISRISYEFPDRANFEIPTRVIFAIAKELDGALRDIRATRTKLHAVLSDSDLRADFKVWHETNRKR